MSGIIDQNVTDVAKFKRMKSGDSEKENFSPLELQKAQQQQDADAAVAGKRRGLIIHKMRPPGAV